jgi:hypothetical protein
MSKYILLVLILSTFRLTAEDFTGEPYYYRNLRIEYGGNLVELVRIELIGFGKDADVYYSTIEKLFLRETVRERINLSKSDREKFYIVVNDSQFFCEKILGYTGKIGKGYWWDSETLNNPGPNRQEWESRMKVGIKEYYKDEHKIAK